MIQEYENSLRYIISHILGDGDSTDFKITPVRLDAWKRRRETEKKKNNDQLVENRIIYFSDLPDLGTIIINNWDKFEVIFHDKERFQVYFNEIKILRNSISHSRDLLPYQEHFLSFVVGDLKTQITKYHNKNMKVDDFLIRILKVSDNIGQVWNSPDPLAVGFHTNLTLRIGDRLEFLIDAFDPKGKQILYELSCGRLNRKNNDGKFVIEITKEMIAFPASFDIVVSTEENEYPNKARFSAFYTVLP